MREAREVSKPLDNRLRRLLYKAAGYSAFPFHAYDEYGNVILPDDVVLPPEDKEHLEEALRSPKWEQLFSQLSALDDTENWNCYSVGLNYTGNSINLIAAKSLGTIGDPVHARRWCEALGNSMLRAVQQSAGTEWAVDHQLVKGLRAVLDALKRQLSGGGGGGGEQPTPEPGGGNGKPPQPEPAQPAGENEPEALDVAALSPVMALEFLSSLAEFALTMTQPRRITATVLWYVPEDWPAYSSKELLRAWGELERAENIWDGTRRVESCIWNPRIREAVGWKGRHYYLEGRPPMHLGPQNIQEFFYPGGLLAKAEGGESQ
jgi:hypothetical protein